MVQLFLQLQLMVRTTTNLFEFVLQQLAFNFDLEVQFTTNDWTSFINIGFVH